MNCWQMTGVDAAVGIAEYRKTKLINVSNWSGLMLLEQRATVRYLPTMGLRREIVNERKIGMISPFPLIALVWPTEPMPVVKSAPHAKALPIRRSVLSMV